MVTDEQKVYLLSRTIIFLVVCYGWGLILSSLRALFYKCVVACVKSSLVDPYYQVLVCD